MPSASKQASVLAPQIRPVDPVDGTPAPLVLAVHTVGQVGSRRFLWGHAAGTTRHYCVEVSETAWRAFVRAGGAVCPPFLVEVLGAEGQPELRALPGGAPAELALA